MSGNGKGRRFKALQSKVELDWQDLGQAGFPSDLVADVGTGLTAGPTDNSRKGNGAETLQQTWTRRAARLARVPAEQEKGAQVELVLVRLGNEIYGLDVQCVSDIRPAELFTRVPRTPDWVAGVVNLRGRILSLLDLQRFLGLPQAEDGERVKPYLVVVEAPGAEMEVALLADEVLDVEALPASRLHDAAGTLRGIRPEYVRGIAERGQDGDGALVVVLDLPALLADKQLIVYEEIA